MHKLKSQAKHNAWYDDPDRDFLGLGIQNPFKKYTSPTTTQSSLGPTDLETLARRRTDPVPIRTEARLDTRRESSDEIGPIQRTESPIAEQQSHNDLEDANNNSGQSSQTIAHDVASDSDTTHSGEGDNKPISEPKGHSLLQIFAARLQGRKQSFDTTDSSRYVFTIGNQLRNTVFNSWLNILFVFVPAGFVVYYTHRGPRTTFAFNFLAIIPSSAMLSFAIEELMLRTGEVLGALISMTFSNTVQLISSILLLKSRQIDILKMTLLGSIMSNLLLMTGLGFFLGGLRHMQQKFNAKLAQTIGIMLLLAVLSLVIPTASLVATGSTSTGIDIVSPSRGTSIVILVSYICWLVFQLKTHKNLFVQETPLLTERNDDTGDFRKTHLKDKLKAQFHDRFHRSASPKLNGKEEEKNNDYDGEVEDRKVREPNLSITVCFIVILISVTLIGFNAEFATNSIQGLLQSSHLSQNFIGLVILPLISIDPTSVVVAVQNQMDLSLALTLERCLQTALMIVPLVVLIAWPMGVNDMTLHFDSFSVASLFVSIIIVVFVVQEGRSNWLVGALLIKIYVIVAVACFYLPQQVTQ